MSLSPSCVVCTELVLQARTWLLSPAGRHINQYCKLDAANPAVTTAAYALTPKTCLSRFTYGSVDWLQQMVGLNERSWQHGGF